MDIFNFFIYNNSHFIIIISIKLIPVVIMNCVRSVTNPWFEYFVVCLFSLTEPAVPHRHTFLLTLNNE